MLEIVSTQGDEDLARVFVARLPGGTMVELVESVQPPIPRQEKWVLIVSTLVGCPIGCPICDAGGDFRGKLNAEEILAQIDFLIARRFPSRVVEIPKLKVQFARMGEPALNDAVLEALQLLPTRMDAAGLMPCLSTVAPRGREAFFDDLLAVKEDLYGGGRFQLQFSVHSTDEQARRFLVPASTWSLEEMAAYGERFYSPNDRKVTLSFAPARGLPLDPEALVGLFSPEVFLIKLTPINETRASLRAGLHGLIDPADARACEAVADRFRTAGFETLLSMGELAENEIGSNCGMYVGRARAALGARAVRAPVPRHSSARSER